ncbi:RES domain-containing protein [Microbacterium sp.]|uniref:RES domain-containing protein n=1 Tax=Microbacterium sp. TaxID=51671 RepID=UPI00261411FE|nr:RES domain-containing protein [Microbacterium sp.]
MEPSDFYGIYGMDETVCLDHITDRVLRDLLSFGLSEFRCSFCGRSEPDGGIPFAILMDELGDRVWEAANWLYEGTEDVQFSEDGEPWSYETLYETNDVIYDTVEDALDPRFSMEIVERIKEATKSTDYWVGSERADPSAIGWASFARTVRFESRFVFIGSSERPGYEDEPPARIARFLEALLTYVESDLLIELPAGSTLYRGRMADDVSTIREKVQMEPSGELGPAPANLAETGRLSARGIGLFYAADDLDTAVAEIALHSNYDQAIVGGFTTTRPLKVLDFTRPLLDLPSVFATDSESRRRWTFARFKNHFTDMISAPVLLDGRQLVDYTPSQVVSEWLRFVPKTRIDGIAWPSHVTKGEGKNLMLFFGPGTDFQTDPPTESEQKRYPSKHPALTLSRADITEHRVERSVAVFALEVDEDW